MNENMTTNDIAAELDNLAGVCRAAADSDSAGDKERALFAVEFSLRVLNEKLSAISQPR